MSDLEKWWTPKFVCLYCDKRLRNQSSQNFNFTTPMVWREPTNHLDDCYFCSIGTSSLGFQIIKNKDRIVYSKYLKSAILPTFEEIKCNDHSSSSESDSVDESDKNFNDHDSGFENNYDGRKLHLINQLELNDIFRDANLTKEQSELIASRLKQFNLVTNDTRVTFYRNREHEFRDFYEEE